jgi:hypothetical protein
MDPFLQAATSAPGMAVMSGGVGSSSDPDSLVNCQARRLSAHDLAEHKGPPQQHRYALISRLFRVEPS